MESEAPAATSSSEVQVRPISTEDMIRAHLDFIFQVRVDLERPDRINVWSEAVEALSDETIPWQDRDFIEAWNARQVASTGNDGNGRPIFTPTASDVRAAQILIMELLTRQNMLARRRTLSKPPPRPWNHAHEDSKRTPTKA